MAKTFDGLTNQSFAIRTNRNILAVYYNPVKPNEEAAYEGCDEGKIKLRLSSYVKNPNGSTRTTGVADFNLDIKQFEELEQNYDLAVAATALVKLELAKGMPIPMIEGKELVPRAYYPKVYDRVKDQAGNSPASIMTLDFQLFYKGEPKRNPWMLHLQQGSAPASRTPSGGTNFAVSKFVVGKTETGGSKDVSMMMSMSDFRSFIKRTRKLIDKVEDVWQETQLPAFLQAWDAYKGNPGPMPGLAGLMDQVLTRLVQIQQAMGLQAAQPVPTPIMQKAMEQARQRDAKQGYNGPAPQGNPYQGQPGSMAMPPQGTPYQAPPMNGAPYQAPPAAGPMPHQGALPPQGMPAQGPAPFQGGMTPQAPPMAGPMPRQGAMPPQGMPAQGPTAPQAPPMMGPAPQQGPGPQAPPVTGPAPAAGAPAQPQGEPMDLKILADQVVYLQSGASVMRCQDPAGAQMSLAFKGQPPREYLEAQKSGTPIKGRFAKKDLPGIGKCLVPA